MEFRYFFVRPRPAHYVVLGAIAFALSSCATAATSAPILPVEVQPLPATSAPADLSTAVNLQPTAAPADLSTAVNLQPTAAPATQVIEVQAVATSRGPNLEATDPATVNLAAGQLQLVEFFRFT